MREILYRGKKTGFNEWAQGYITSPCEKTMCVLKQISPNVEWYVDAETVGQYTGVTDRNGTKIFEGDIVKGYSATGTLDFDKSVVLWSELFSQWQVEGSALFGSKICATYEVIGNIHDNPELLKEGAKQ